MFSCVFILSMIYPLDPQWNAEHTSTHLNTIFGAVRSQYTVIYVDEKEVDSVCHLTSLKTPGIEVVYFISLQFRCEEGVNGGGMRGTWRHEEPNSRQNVVRVLDRVGKS